MSSEKTHGQNSASRTGLHMKVILSVQPIRFPLTGIGRYTLELARHLPAVDDIEELQFFSDDRFVPSLPVPQDSITQSASLIDTIKRRLARNPLLLELHRWRVRRRRQKALSGKEDFLYHGPNFSLPPFSGRAVVTIHDLSIFTMPECHPPERVGYLRAEIEHALKHATCLITDSDYTRREVADYFGWPLDLVHAVPLASAADFRPQPVAELVPALARHGLSPGGYTFYAGTIEPRKNIAGLLSAYERLPAALRRRFPLILGGYKGWNNEAIMAQIARAEKEGWARYLNFVSAEDLPRLFAGARLFAFPSLYEGFGLPVLEAMASGVPVVMSNRASLPEVGGNAAAVCDPDDIEILGDLIRQGLEDEVWREQAIREGLSQASRFSWQRCAMETAGVYRAALAT